LIVSQGVVGGNGRMDRTITSAIKISKISGICRCKTDAAFCGPLAEKLILKSLVLGRKSCRSLS
jgi:hypothetical protein